MLVVGLQLSEGVSHNMVKKKSLNSVSMVSELFCNMACFDEV